jgi:osmoprotectant transport system ATP-binding protein
VLLEFDRVSFSFAGHAVLDDFSVSVRPGEVLALLGRSGAGKSTVLKLANGLLTPASGAVRVEGRDTRQWDGIRLRRRIGYVLQDVGLFPHMTLRENIGLVPMLEGWPEQRTHDRAGALLDLVGMPAATYALRFPSELSGGQRQRVGVARALAADPPVLLMDEPFGALDPLTRAEMQREFQRIQLQLRKTVVIVTHDPAEALALSDRVGILHDGRMIACDAPDAIVRSNDARVRVFVEALPRARTSPVDRASKPRAEH